MNSDDKPNPYQSPSEVDLSVESILRLKERIEIDGEITLVDLRQCIAGSKIRLELVGFRRISKFLIVPVVLSVFLLASRVSFAMLTLVGLGFGFFVAIELWRRRIVKRIVRSSTDNLGATTGYLDHTALWIQNENHVRYRPMDQLVSAAISPDQIVLYFDASLTTFECIPLGIVDDPDTLRLVAECLAQSAPPVVAKISDDRRMELSDDEPKFTATEDAAHYSGTLYPADVAGTPFLRRLIRQIRNALILNSCVFVSLSYVMYWFVGFDTFSFLAIVVFAVLSIRVTIQLLRQRDHFLSNVDPLWKSAGWIDREGVVSMSTIGQTQAKWPMLDERVITDRAITLGSRRSTLTYIVGRDQFSDQSAWLQACNVVRSAPST